VSEGVRRAGQVAWALVGLAAVLVLVGLVAWTVRIIWPPLILAGAIVFLLNPVVSALRRRHVPRAAGAAIAYVGVLVLLALTGLALWPLASQQAEDFTDRWPELRADVERWIDDRADDSQNWPIQVPTVAEIEDELAGGSESIGDRIGQARAIGTTVFHIALVLLLAPVIAFYLLVDLPHLRRVAESLVPIRRRSEVLLVAGRLNRAVGGFFRGQLLVAVLVGAMVSVGLALIDLPFWLLVGIVAGGFNIIPLIGPWVGAVPGVIIALTTRDLTTALWVSAVMLGAQQVDNHFISPMVMRRAVKLHPAAVILALLAGGGLGGFFGLLVAVPTAAVLKILCSHLWRTYVLGEPLDVVAATWEADDADPGVGPVEAVVLGRRATPREAEEVDAVS
jgi:predicted PurR-regulated permease PerM